MPKDIFPQTTPEIAARRKQLAPDVHDAFTSFSARVFAAGSGVFLLVLIGMWISQKLNEVQ